ncbi:hypothetical protein Q5762_38360, partial [Streptomyces sp. P9(2023)]|uniref:hypothetical protein n=1 Tax=Streptomyces sp. P9(2023) TaxID=3064394 RepID=UPI0028F429EC
VEIKITFFISTVATSILLLSACGGQNKTADSSSQTSITATSKSGSEAQSSTQQSVATEASSSVAQPGPSETQNTESNATLPVPGEANLTTS